MIDIKNPELLRYVRSELRPARVATIIGGTLFGAILLALIVSINADHRFLSRITYWREVYAAVFIASTVVLVLWTLLNSSQAIVGERTHRTFDFWRTTRLSPLTLATGKLFGAPIGAWLQYATALPILVITGLLGGYHITTTIGSYLLLALFDVALGSVALCLSMRAQDGRRSTMLMFIIALSFLPNVSFGIGGSEAGAGVFSAWSAMNPARGVAAWHDGYPMSVMLFGHAVPSLLLSVALSLAVIAWCMAALVRSVKMEPEQRSLFSPLQVVGVSASILLFVYAAYRPFGFGFDGADNQHNMSALFASGLVATLLCLYFTLVSTLYSRDDLRHGLRTMNPGQIVSRLVAPWVATGMIGLFAAAWALVGYRRAFEGVAVPWSGVIGTFLVITAYAVRDGMFLQWMISQRVKMPVLKGTVLLVCYYVGTAVMAATLVGPERMGQMLRWLTPIASDPSRPQEVSLLLAAAMLVPPLATAALLASGVFRTMQRAAVRIGGAVNA
jgi:hypothetical protein